MNRDRKQRFWDGERFRFPEYYEIETNRYFDTFRDLENNTPIKNLVASDSTGLTDKNGEDVFEGDILFDDYENNYWEVIYSANAFLLQNIKDKQRHKICANYFQYSISGNLYENPELLKP